MHIGEHSRAVMPGDVIIVPPAAEQWIENPGVSPLEYLVIVSPPWRAEDDTQLE
jgi:mannose-6-phosphate isomerase-like protein (cupin superfamily)